MTQFDSADSASPVSSLLPTGIADVLYPQSDINTRTLNALLSTAFSFGYEQVCPPLVEFTDTLNTPNAFHVLDPVSNRMMAIRSDMTPQINRIVQNRLYTKDRPIRLMYGGNVLRVQGSHTRPSREYTQFGAELIGVDSPYADIEILTLAIQALKSVHINHITVDICIPKLAYVYAKQLGVHPSHIDAVLSSRNIHDLNAYAADIQQLFKALLTPQQSIEKTLQVLNTLPPCDKIAGTIQRVQDIVQNLPKTKGVQITVDPCENRGFSFQDGVGFTLFCRSSQAPLGRGGKYTLGTNKEPAVGFSLYFDSLQQVASVPQDILRVYAPFGTEILQIQGVRNQGHVVVMGLTPDINHKTDALNNNCTHILIDSALQQIKR